MSAQDNLSKKQFISLSHGKGEDEANKVFYEGHHIQAHDEQGNKVGQLLWNAEGSGSIAHVGVNKPIRGQGIASHMWDLAHSVSEEQGLTGPKHVTQNMTNDGYRFMKKVGKK